MNTQRLKHVFFWLSGAGAETLDQCPNWEQRKYVAFGATVLVPSVFALIACAYALSTLTDDWRVIVPVSLAWAFIILTIDRALLATYRSFQSLHRKFLQFCLRMVVAMLMGITISHPLTLLLFQDTVTSVIEDERESEIAGVRADATTVKTEVGAKITALEADIAAQRANWNQTFSAEFLVEDTAAGQLDPTADLDPETKAEMETKMAEAIAPIVAKLDAANNQFATETASYQKLQGELDHWQKEFEREVNGQRSGIVGLGPRARSIHDDQLTWRREEAKRIGEVLAFLTQQQTDLATEKKATESRITEEYLAIGAEKAERLKAERERIAGLKRQVQQEQASQFVDQQNAIRSTIASQIDTRLAELTRLQGEIAKLATDEQDRVDAIKAEPRRDILTQTLALHKLFEAGQDGGRFALIAYGVLALLFMLVDTIPLIVKFFSKPGPYDALVDCEEVRFDREREAFLKSYHRYMDELASGRLLHLSPANKPLERSLIEGVDRSRAAKEFIEHLIDLEHAFEERIAEERELLAAKANGDKSARARAAILEDMAQTFYDDLRERMGSFFDPEAARAAAIAAARRV
ncbi:MAG: DUF4407 domain-containing protein [Verrucomicrobiae bacterium]|nr:DUF4407 domain-containing protein [Verrucomicrobiae bacterium]MCB1090486.1 DUF4407 domain-containing protein [Verrucomicrobiae bacterium]